MEKIKVAPRDAVVPRTPVLVGTVTEDGRPNYITVVTMGWPCFDVISVSLGRSQFSTECIRKSLTFSVNFPSAQMVEKLDFCGMHSGRAVDKSVQFDNFFGELDTAPMIRECPVSFSCTVEQVLEKPQHAVFIGSVVDAFVTEDCMTGSMADVSKTNPLLYTRVPGEGKSGAYFGLGETIGKAWNVGSAIDPKKL